MNLNLSLLMTKKSKKSNLKELTDAKLDKVVGGVSFTSNLVAACSRCKYKYKATAAFNHSLI